jgi:acylphosphatase
MVEIEQYRIHLRVEGRVQGVGFRWFVVSEARRLGVSGWVRNTQDGAVELEASGTSDQLAALRARVSEGPPAARVQHVIDLAVTSAPLPAPFAIVR